MPVPSLLPLAPWGVAWCCLGIVALFDEVLRNDGGRPERGRMGRVVRQPRAARRPSRCAVVCDAAGAPARALDLALFTAVLPGRVHAEKRRPRSEAAAVPRPTSRA
jgi:hypothetical protein